MYEYRAKVTHVVDGDTIDVRVDLGFKIYFDIRLRLFGIDTPELRGEEYEAGMKAKRFVEEKVLDREVIVKTHKDKTGKYGRYLAEVFYDDVSLNQTLLGVGLARLADY